MDLTGPAMTYILLIIPTLFAIAVTGQGVVKIQKKDPQGKTITVFGVIFLVLILVAYFFFIK